MNTSHSAHAATPLHHLPPRTHPLLRLNHLCPYFTMFPLDFPFYSLARAQGEQWVLDPFCGRGTTNFAARLRGLPSVGLDSNPVAAAIAAAKLVSVTSGEVIELCRTILSETPEPDDVPCGRFWELCFDPQTLVGICRIRHYLLEHCTSETEIALRAIMLGILHGPRLKTPTYLSNQMPRTYATKPGPAVHFWEKRSLRPPRIDVLEAVTRRARFSLSQVPPVVGGRVLCSDSRTVDPAMLGGPFHWIVTSPPYFGMRSYRPDQWLRNWFLGGPGTVTYSQDGQLPHRGVDRFVAELARVWRRMAAVCAPQARLVVRFGALPSYPVDSTALLKRSLALADCGWRVLTVRSAGKAADGKRQAEQFRKVGRPIAEIDLYALLEV